MKTINHSATKERIQFNSPDVKNAFMKVLIGPEEGWQDHVMRVIELEDFGYSPRHAHPWPHINYFLEGEGILEMEGEETLVSEGDYAFVPGGVLHQFRSRSAAPFRFICIVPKEGHR